MAVQLLADAQLLERCGGIQLNQLQVVREDKLGLDGGHGEAGGDGEGLGRGEQGGATQASGQLDGEASST